MFRSPLFLAKASAPNAFSSLRSALIKHHNTKPTPASTSDQTKLKSAPPLQATGEPSTTNEDAPGVPAWATAKLAHSQTLSKRNRDNTRAYIELTKPRLTALIVLSAMSAYALAPAQMSLQTLALLTVGTSLCSSSANAINMGREPEFDAMMTRTRTRPVASGRLTSQQAFKFAAATGTAGVATLLAGVNPTVAALGLANIYLYGGLYTTLKRKSIANTWVGAIVGAIPPLMGWAACSSLSDPGAWMLAGLLYSWQFPHFMSLSYVVGEEYKRAGYVMSGWTDPQLTARVSVRHALAMFPLCFGMVYFNVVDQYFLLDSSITNFWLLYTSLGFWKQQRQHQRENSSGQKTRTDNKYYARQLFWASVIHLPAILLLAMIHKKGQWDWFFDWLRGDNEHTEDVAV